MLLRVSGAPRGDRDGSPDFFVSYTRSDQLWAEWISWVLEDAGFRVVVQAWDFGPGAHSSPTVLFVTVAVTLLVVAAVQQAHAKWGSAHASLRADHSDVSHHHDGSAG
jgi:hypothetical protein